MRFLTLLYNVLSLTFITFCINVMALYVLSKSGTTLPEITMFTFLAIFIVIAMFSLINKYIYQSELLYLNDAQFKLSVTKIYVWIGVSILFTLLSIICGYLLNSGSIRIANVSLVYSIYFAFITALLPGMVEEICYRWFLYGMLKKDTNKFIAATITGLIFALMHFNQANTFSSKVLLLCSGVLVTYLFCAIYERTKSIWPGAILHVIWDMFYTDTVMLVHHVSKLVSPTDHNIAIITLVNNNTLISGGDFGLDSSLSSMILYLLAAILIIKWKKKDSVAKI